MKLHRVFLATNAVSILGLLVGCASDPNKKVETAETNLTSEHQEARQDQAALERRQASERAEKQNAGWEQKVELRSEHQAEQAEQTSESSQGIHGAERGVVEARANLVEERRDVDAKVRERLAKADARAEELARKSAKLDAKRAADFRTNEKQFRAARGEVDARANTLRTTPDGSFASVRSDVEKRLDVMESALNEMAKDL